MNSKTKERGMFILGVTICFALAALPVLIEKLIPGALLGTSLFFNVIMSVCIMDLHSCRSMTTQRVICWMRWNGAAIGNPL